MATSWNRRNLLRGGLSLAVLGKAAPALALIDPKDVSRLLGQMPQQLKAALPADVVQVADVIAQVAGLEGQARALNLPGSKLSTGEGAISADPERIYELAMPRLVALIDRAERADPGLADKAGGLLAKLHATQHVVAEALARLDAGGGLPLLQFGPDLPGGGALKLPDVTVTRPQEPAPDPVLGPPSTSLKFDDIGGELLTWFKAARIRPERAEHAAWHLTMMQEARPRYEAVGKRLGIPWHFIAAIHGLEASFNFRAHLHNGDFPLTARTRQVPTGRPRVWLPPSDWEDSAADALRLMGFAGEADWSLARTLYRLEAFNGFGYRRMGRSSPYLWSFSTLFDRGKYVSDGHFDPNARSHQCGAAVMLKVLADAGQLAS